MREEILKNEFNFSIKIAVILSCLYISSTEAMGFGVFTSENIDANTIIEASPVIIMSHAERILLDQTQLHDYIFEWGEKKENCCVALGYVSLYNHAYKSNCEYAMDFANRRISIKTVRFVRAGDELFINYNGNWNNGKRVWFDVK